MVKIRSNVGLFVQQINPELGKQVVLKADMKSYIPLETAAMFFSSEPFS